MSTSGVSRTEAQAKRSRKTPAERRAELMDAAALVFLEKGYEAATVADITGRAGSSHGTFYVYFDSKEDIFDAVAQDRVMVAFDAVKECADQRDRPAVDRIRDILKMNSEPELTGWWVEEFSRSYMTNLRERLIHKALETFPPVLTDLLREAVCEGSIMRTLSEMPQVISAEGVSGHYDVIAIMRGPDLETLQDTILSTVRGVNGIESTETWIVMVPQPDTWTQDELNRFVAELDEKELTAIRVLLEKRRGMMIPELIDAISQKLEEEEYDIHDLTVTLISMTRKAEDQYRRENVIEFDQDMGYFLNERYLEMLEASLSRL